MSNNNEQFNKLLSCDSVRHGKQHNTSDLQRSAFIEWILFRRRRNLTVDIQELRYHMSKFDILKSLHFDYSVHGDDTMCLFRKQNKEPFLRKYEQTDLVTLKGEKYEPGESCLKVLEKIYFLFSGLLSIVKRNLNINRINVAVELGKNVKVFYQVPAWTVVDHNLLILVLELRDISQQLFAKTADNFESKAFVIVAGKLRVQ